MVQKPESRALWIKILAQFQPSNLAGLLDQTCRPDSLPRQ